MMLAVLLSLAPAEANPGIGFFRTKSRVRNFDCDRVSFEVGSQQYPGEINLSPSRAAENDRTAVICRERLMRAGLRSPRDEAVLSTLTAQTDALAGAAAALRPDLAGATWLVESFFPSQVVAGKLDFATKNALVGSGLHVSDRTPMLSAGDIDVVTRMPPFEAYPVACGRYRATGALGENDALLAVVNLDPRETKLHAGVCAGGTWGWLQ